MQLHEDQVTLAEAPRALEPFEEHMVHSVCTFARVLLPVMDKEIDRIVDIQVMGTLGRRVIS